MIIKEIKVKNYLTKSNLPGIDFTINPYIGCSHKCRYCYASFMKKITNHSENWGDFIDIKLTEEEIDLKKIQNKTIFLSSVTDSYLSFEKEYLITRSILEEIKNSNCKLIITTKSSLILRDLDILKQIKNLTVCISINTIDERFKNDMDKASSIKERIKTLKILHENNISTVAFISPIFPYIINIEDIVKATKYYVDEYWFENLKYLDIYFNENMSYFKNLSLVIKDICSKYNIKYEIFWDKKEEKNLKQESFNFF